MARCFVTRQLPGPALDRLRDHHEVDVWDQRLPPPYDELRRRVADVDGLLALLTDRIDADVIAGAPRLRAIANYAVGYDNIDLAAAAARGIAVGNTPDVLTDATADLTFALLLAAARGLLPAAASVNAGDWLTWEPGRYLGADVYGATLGIVGMGRIGRAVAQRAGGFDMTVLHTRRTGGEGAQGGHGGPGGESGTGGDGGEGAVSFDELLARSDFVSLHCPLTPQTRGLIDAAALSRMRPGAVLINTARGPIVDQAALVDALHAGTIAGAALDVTDPEPPPPGDPILTAPNLLLVPHIGSATRTARQRMATLAVDNLLAALDGRPMPHPVGGAGT